MTEATRRQLLDAGRRRFARQGLEGARVDRIAEDAGVNKALINYHFRGKLGLYEAVMREVLERLDAELAALLLPIEDPGDRLRAWPGALAGLMDASEDLPSLILGELLRRPDAELPGEALMTESLAADGADASLGEIDADAMLRVLLGSILLDRLGGSEAGGRKSALLLEALIDRGLTS